MENPNSPNMIISGGQTGADRAALDWAIAHSIPHGGWCPAGRIAEDGIIPAKYQLTEMPDGGGYRQRNKANVQNSDATLILTTSSELSGGSIGTSDRHGSGSVNQCPNGAEQKSAG